jgi:aspartyl-tRNA(Asn)/glutamyl-tRNA(Gln) amidotransferase subunit A
VFGLKPSFGTIPIFPAPIADTLVHAGVVTRTVTDASLLLSVIAGPDPRDRNSLPRVEDPARGAETAMREVRVAWCPNIGDVAVTPEIRRACEKAIRQYEQAGLKVEEIELNLPETAQAFRTLYQSMFGAPLVDALPKWRASMDPGLVALVEEGRLITAYELAKTNLARAALWDALRGVFETYQFLFLPVTHTLPPLVNSESLDGEQHAAPPEGVTFLYPFNLTGQPAASIPCGWSDSGLPIGLQIVGRRFQNQALLHLAAACEAIAPWAHRRPVWTN